MGRSARRNPQGILGYNAPRTLRSLSQQLDGDSTNLNYDGTMYLYGRFEQGIWHFVYTTMTGDLETDTPVISRVFRGGLKSSHIFIREAAAAIWGIRHALRRRHWRNVKIHLVTDNSAVAFALRSLYSSNDVVCGWIRQLAMELKDAGCTLEVEQVPSAMNPADPPSRLAAVDNDIRQRG